MVQGEQEVNGHDQGDREARAQYCDDDKSSSPSENETLILRSLWWRLRGGQRGPLFALRHAVLAECFWSRSATNMTSTPMPTPIMVKRTRRPSAA